MLIRSRVEDDLTNLKIATQSEAEIIVTPTADYLYRIVLRKETWAKYLYDEALNIDYINVKGTIGRDRPRHNAMMECWYAMGKLQPRGPYGGFYTDKAPSTTQQMPLPFKDE